MTNVTKNEKLLRKATSKWEKFLAEGAFKKTLKEFDSDDAYHFDVDKGGEDDFTAAANFDMGDVVKVMNRGKPRFDEPEELRCRVGTVTGMDGRDLTIKFDDNGEVATITYFNASKNQDLWNAPKLFNCPEEQASQVNEGGTMGEYGKTDAEDGNPPSKIGRGNEEYMAAFNAVMQKMGKEPLPIVQPDQAYLDALSRGNLEEQEEQGFQVGEFVYIIDGGLRGATGKIAEPTTLVTGEQGYVIQLYSDADKKVFGKQGDEVIAGASKIRSGGTFDGSELYDIDEAVSGKEQYYLKQQNRAKGAAMALLNAEQERLNTDYILQQANIIVAAMVALERMITSDNIDETAQWGGFTGGAAPLDEPVRDSGQVPLEQLKKLFSIFTEMGLSPDAILQKPEFAEAGITNPAQLDERSEDDDGELEPAVKYGSGATLRFNRRTGEFYDVERDIYLDDEEAYALIKETVRKTLSSKKKVKSVKENSPLPSATRVKYSSDPEMNQVMRIAAEMLEMPSRSRGTITLKSVQSALEAHSIDSVIENDMIIVDNKYVIAKKELLPKTAQKISFTSYAADYLSNLQGEQQDLPMEEQERPDFATSYSSDPHLDQIEDYALTVIEKGGNLRQLEDVLNRDGFATFLNGDVLTVDDEFFVGNEENFDISPDEDVRRLTGSNLVVGRTK